MLVAGGVYVETCLVPASRSLLGSAGRAALSLAELRSDLELHTFHPSDQVSDIEANFGPFGIRTVVYESPARVEFTYLYPLSAPIIRPIPIPSGGTQRVTGATVLRFGCLEGDFQVSGKKVVYDPQGSTPEAAFRCNGSTADELALVLNASEARVLSNIDDLELAGSHLLDANDASVVVIKDGPRGAFVFEPSSVGAHVPAYDAATLFKIGSGDIFTAVFAHYWLEGTNCAESADLASRYTAQYVANRSLPLQSTAPSLKPMQGTSDVEVLVVGDDTTIAGRWLLDEVRQALDELGATVVPLDDDRSGLCDAMLVVSCDDPTEFSHLRRSVGDRAHAVAFVENPHFVEPARAAGFFVTDDLSRAIYEVFWMAP